jgi:hypothetical protein
MTTQPTAADHLQQAAAELRRDEHGNWPGTWRAPSQRKMHRPQLERETALVWLLPEAEGRGLPWLRERFPTTRPKRSDLIAFTTDTRGRCIRAWFSRREDQAAYLQMVASGAGTCPIEAVHPPSIQLGQPSQPAHPHLLPALWANIAAAEGTPVELPQPDPEVRSRALVEVERAFWKGIQPEALEQADG